MIALCLALLLGQASSSGGVNSNLFVKKTGSTMTGELNINIPTGDSVSPSMCLQDSASAFWWARSSQQLYLRQGTSCPSNGGTTIWEVIDPAATFPVSYAGAGLSTAGRLLGTTGLVPGGVATGSLPACNSTAPSSGGTRGTIQYDTSTTTLKYCDGATWQTFDNTASTTNRLILSLSGYTTLCTDSQAFAAVKALKSATATMNCSMAVVPQLAGGTGSLVVNLYNQTTSTSMLSVTIAQPPTVGNVSSNKTTGLTVASDDIVILRTTGGNACNNVMVNVDCTNAEH